MILTTIRFYLNISIIEVLHVFRSHPMRNYNLLRPLRVGGNIQEGNNPNGDYLEECS